MRVSFDEAIIAYVNFTNFYQININYLVQSYVANYLVSVYHNVIFGKST